MLTDHKEIKKWLDVQGIVDYDIRPDGVVDVHAAGGVNLSSSIYLFEQTLPVQFGNVTGYFSCSYSELTSLQGSPRVVTGDFICNQTKIESLSGVDKIVKQINGTFLCDRRVTHILGLLLIKGITNIDVDMCGPIDCIMNKYIGTGDILSAQDELIDAGFIDQARL
jgi:hypothetical protein